MEIPTLEAEMGFSDTIVIALLDLQAKKTYLRQWTADNSDKLVNSHDLIVIERPKGANIAIQPPTTTTEGPFQR